MKAARIAIDEAREIAAQACICAYPLVLMDVSRRVMTNCETIEPAHARAPVNQFCHVPAFPDAAFSDVVRPNADTALLDDDVVRRRPRAADHRRAGLGRALLAVADVGSGDRRASLRIARAESLHSQTLESRPS